MVPSTTPPDRLRRVLPRPAPGGILVISAQHPFMEWLRKRGSYFGTNWKPTPGTPQTTTSRSGANPRPPCAPSPPPKDSDPVAHRTTPAPSMLDRYPDDYHKLSTEPGFLIFRLIKPPVLPGNSAP